MREAPMVEVRERGFDVKGKMAPNLSRFSPFEHLLGRLYKDVSSFWPNNLEKARAFLKIPKYLEFFCAFIYGEKHI